TIFARASSPKRISLAAIADYLKRIAKKGIGNGSGPRSAEDREDVVFLDHQQVGAVELHFGAAVLAEQHLVADLDLRRAQAAVVQGLALADRDNLALDRLLGGRVRDHDAAGGHLFFFHTLDDHAVEQRLDIHGNL